MSMLMFLVRFSLEGFSSSKSLLLLPLATLVCCCCLLIVKYSTRQQIAVNTIVVLGSFILFIRSISTGGISSPVTFWLILIPIISILLSSKKSGVFWTVITLGLLQLIYHAESLGIPISAIKPSHKVNLYVFSILICLLSSIIYFFEQQRISHQNFLIKLESELALSKKLAALGTMSGGIAHEINNPLAIIKGKAQILERLLSKENPDLEKSQSIVQTLNSNASRIQAIVGALKTFSTDNNQNSNKILNLISPLELALSTYGSSLESNSIKLINNVHEMDLRVSGQTGLLQILFENLIKNAIHEIKNQGKPWIKIEQVYPTDTQNIFISFTDSGTGIPAHIAENIMDPFFTTKDFGEGTGLGLSLCQNVIRVHEGELTINKDSKNTQFIIRLPLHQTNIS